jgi:arginase
MGAGPERLLDAGLQRALTDQGHRVHASIAELPAGSWQSEIQTSFELMRMLAVGVANARAAGRLPVVLAGNCNTAVGTIGGLGGDVGVAWFDAHGDLNTPETTTTGFLDGTALAVITGKCFTRLAASVPGFAPVSENRVCLIGARDLDSAEAVILADSPIERVAAADVRTRLPRALALVGEHVERMYVHIDLDVLDSAVASANTYAVPGGLTVEDVEAALTMIAADFGIAAVTLSAYDPAADTDGRAAAAAIRLITRAAGLAQQS